MLPHDCHFILRLAANHQYTCIESGWQELCYQSIFFGSKQCISLKNLSTLRLFLNQISIATTSAILPLVSRSKTALVHHNIQFLETLSLLILRKNLHACVGICRCIPAASALVSYSNASPWQWNGYYLQTDTDVRYEKSYTYRQQRRCMNEAVGGVRLCATMPNLLWRTQVFMKAAC